MRGWKSPATGLDSRSSEVRPCLEASVRPFCGPSPGGPARERRALFFSPFHRHPTARD